MPKQLPRLYRILILEDDLEAASKILGVLYRIEPHLAPYDFDITLLSTCQSVESLINGHCENDFDIILLDRDCKMNGSFHILDMERFGVEKIISISSKPEWNQLAQARGVGRVVPKSFSGLDDFARDIGELVLELLQNRSSNPSASVDTIRTFPV